MKQIKLAKHSALIQMTNTMTAEQRKIYNYLIFEAKEQLRENPKRTVFEVEIWNICKYTGAQNNFHIKQSVKAMESITVKVNSLGKDKKRKWEPFILLEEVMGMDELQLIQAKKHFNWAYLRKSLEELKEYVDEHEFVDIVLDTEKQQKQY